MTRFETATDTAENYGECPSMLGCCAVRTLKLAAQEHSGTLLAPKDADGLPYTRDELMVQADIAEGRLHIASYCVECPVLATYKC